MRTHLATSIGAVAASLALAGTASAADRYAEPGGNGPNPCALADPCSINTAVSFAQDGDVVRVLDGTYALNTSLSFFQEGVTMVPHVAGTRPVIRLDHDTKATVIVGDDGLAPKPIVIRGFTIENTSDVTDADNHPALQIGSRAVLSDIVARSRGRVALVAVEEPGASRFEDIRFEQVAGTERALVFSSGAAPKGTVTGKRLTVAAATGAIGAHVVGDHTELTDSVVSGGATGLALQNGPVVRRVSASGTEIGMIASGPATVTDSVATANGANSRAVIGGGAVELRNVTAVASGAGSFGIATAAGATTARNVIARGDQTDLKVGAGSLTVDHSNFRTQDGIVDGGANQSADPQFVNAAAGNFRLAPTSPAIDAGVADDVMGATDRDGASRFQLAAPDLGAYEAAVKGTPPGQGPGSGGGTDTTAPTLANLRGSGKRGRAAKARFSLSEAATVTVRLRKAKPGKRKGGRCVKPTRKLRNAKSCKRFVTIATVTRTLAAGEATVKVGRKLAPGSYRIKVRAKDATGNAAKPASDSFKVARKRG